MIEHAEGQLPGTGKNKLYWQGWVDDSASTRGVVLVSHGVHEHGGRYEWVGRQLAAQGYPVHAIDHAGHGRSDGPRGQLGRMAEVADGVDALITLASFRHPAVPRFLLGHSLGALITLQYVTGNPQALDGVILSGPPLLQDVISPVQAAAARVLSRVAPNLGIAELNSTLVSRDPEVVAYHHTNPLMVRGKVRARTAAESMAAVNGIRQRLPRLRAPFLVMVGTEDKLVDPAGADLAMDLVGSTDKTLKRYVGFYHEVLNEPEKEVVLGDLVQWLKEHS
jgi:acylglycerol lipase